MVLFSRGLADIGNRKLIGMRKLIAILLILPCVSFSTNYYFSSSQGNDSRSASEAQNQSTPWKTLAKFNAVRGSISPGDSVLFKRGDVFYGYIDADLSGQEEAPIIFGAYGTGENPVISRLRQLSSFTDAGDSIFTKSHTASKINITLVDGIVTGRGRYPENTYLHYESYNSTSITDNQLSGTPSWVGSTVCVWENAWTLSPKTVTGHSGGTISYSSGSGFNGYGYFFQNDDKCLTYQNAWSFGSNTFKIYMTDTPGDHSIYVGLDTNAIQTWNDSYLTFSNLTIEGANEYGVYVQGGNKIIFKNCTFTNIGGYGIRAYSNDGLTIENCTFRNILNEAIRANSPNALITNNTFDRIGLIAGAASAGDSHSGIDIEEDSDNVEVSYNIIDSIGYNGITLRGDYAYCHHNNITNVGLIKSDGGGIYTMRKDFRPRIINYNIINNCVGDGSGTASGVNIAEGIYIDEPADSITVNYNVISKATAAGIRIHNSRALTFIGNILFDNKYGFKFNKSGTYVNDSIRDIVMMHNTVVAKDSTQLVLYFESIYNDVAQFGTSDSNYWCRPVYDTLFMYWQWPGIANYNYRDLSDWQTLTSEDDNSSKSNYDVNSSKLMYFKSNYSGSELNQKLIGTYKDVINNSYVGTVNIPAYSAKVLMYFDRPVKTPGYVQKAKLLKSDGKFIR